MYYSIRLGVKIVLVVFALFWLVFALLSGSSGYGGGVWGIVMNSPNALPWLVLLGLVYVAWRWEKVGSILIVMMGIGTLIMVRAWGNVFALFAISGPLIILGGLLLVLSVYFAKKE